MKYTAGQLKQHARLLRGRYSGCCNEDAAGAMAQAELMEAEAGLMDAKAGKISEEQDCTREDTYPILGKISRRGGKIIDVEHQWDQVHVDALRQRDIDMAWEWRNDPRAGTDQGELIRIYIGTRTDGPRVIWTNGKWTSHKSKGNFGKNWACGGNWSTIGSVSADNLNEIAPDLADAIKEGYKMVTEQAKKIEQAEVRVKAANLRILAASQRDYAAGHYRQANHPIYPGQETICIGKAERIEAVASRTEAEADLLLAKAGL